MGLRGRGGQGPPLRRSQESGKFLMRRLSEVEDELSLEGTVLRNWIEQRWIRPTLNDGEPLFDEADMARARLIAELRQDYYVGDEAMPVVLQLLDAVFAMLAKDWGGLDFVVHAIAFSDKEELKGRYVDTTRQNFAMTLDISCFSFTAVSQRAAKLMPKGGSLLTLTYYGAERVMPHYNVMGVAKAALEASVRYLAADLGSDGIRVNAISAGPIKTLAAMGIGDFRHILRWNELNAPLKRNVTIEQVGNAGLYLLSDLSQGVTGEVHHVDSGYHVVGMLRTDAVPEVRVMLQNFEPKG